MSRSDTPIRAARWWPIALSGAVLGTVLGALVLTFPVSRLVWALVVVAVLFVALLPLNPQYRYWRRSSWCLNAAIGMAIVPGLNLQLSSPYANFVALISDASPFSVLGFIGASVIFGWLDFKNAHPIALKQSTKDPCGPCNNDPGSGTAFGLIAVGTLTVNQGMSDETARLLLQQMSTSSQQSHAIITALLAQLSSADARPVDSALVRNLIADIKTARRKMEMADAERLISQLDQLFDRQKSDWEPQLRTEAIIILAEHQRMLIARDKSEGKPVDDLRFRQLLEDLNNV